jgi:uncharacterized protein (DUF2267 family)
MTTALDYLHKSVQTTHVWTKELKAELGWEDEHRSFRALVAVLRALRDSLTDAEVLQLGSQLPVLVAGHYYQGWKLGLPPVRDRSRQAFLGEIDACFHPEEAIDPETVARAVFQLLTRHVSSGEINDVKSVLPKGARALWP